MHDRNVMWKTKDGYLKIKNIDSKHLNNIFDLITRKKEKFILVMGKDEYEYKLHHILQEIRWRKLNRLQIDSEEGELF